jgi:trypsin
MPRRLVLVALVALLALPASTGLGARSVVGGSASLVTAAPWTVFIRQTTRTAILQCTGAVVDAFHIITAAHCTFDQSGNVAAPSAFAIRAGISNFATPAAGDAEQDRGVSSFRVHPGYVWSTGASSNDVAILALSVPLDLSTPQVQAAPLPDGRTVYPRAATVAVTAFGRENSGANADGSLNTFTATVDPQGECGQSLSSIVFSANAVAFCAASPTAATCNGDSGAPVVTADATHTIVGIVSAGPPGCVPGSHGLFTNVDAPEIVDFIQGNDHPVIAPRANDTTFVQLVGQPPLHPGSTLTCTSGNWDGTPSLSYEFFDVHTGQVLRQTAKGTLVITTQIVGNTIGCRVLATNAGGTAMLEATDVETSRVVPPLEIERVSPSTGTRGHVVRVGVWLDPAEGITGKYGVCVTPPIHVGPRACASKHVARGGGRVPLTVALHVGRTAPLGTAKLTVSAAAGPSHGQTRALLHVVA